MPAKNRILECYLCHIQLKSNKLWNLRRHINLHGPFVDMTKCSECGKTYQNVDNYKVHWYAKHTGPPKNPHTVPSRAQSIQNICLSGFAKSNLVFL